MYTAIAVLLSYSIAVMVAGHGALPMAVLLIMSLSFMGQIDFWSWRALPIRAGWIGIVGLVSATFLFRSDPLKRITYQFLSSLILYLSWLVLAVNLGNEE